MQTIDSLHELLKHELKDVYSAEVQIINALPDMIKAATNSNLVKALTKHLTVTKAQKKRLEKIRKLLGEKIAAPERKGFFANLFGSKEDREHCKAMEGLIKEARSLLKQDMTSEVMDAAIIAAAQKIEHYEISSYGTAKAYALQLKMTIVAGMLEETLNEEYEADDSLTALALSKVNVAAEPKSGKTKVNSKSKASATVVTRQTGTKTKSVKKAAQKKTAPKKSSHVAKSAKAPARKKSANNAS